MISVIVVYNDRSQFETMLRPSLERQRRPFELIALDNRLCGFPSAASALNRGGRQARGDFLFFAHQDVRFESEGWLEEAEGYLRTLPDLGIAGLAGARALNNAAHHLVVTNIVHSDPPWQAGDQLLQEVEAVDTVDECAFFVPKEVFDRFGFDERTCSHWHLYAVDLSLTVREAGLRAYALPLPLYHRSSGAIAQLLGFTTYPASYFRILRKVIRKHRARFDRLPTTCGNWSTRQSVLFQQLPPRAFSRAMFAWGRGKLRRAVRAGIELFPLPLRRAVRTRMELLPSPFRMGRTGRQRRATPSSSERREGEEKSGGGERGL